MNNDLRLAATRLIQNLMDRHGLKSVEELTCPDMRALAEAVYFVNDDACAL